MLNITCLLWGDNPSQGFMVTLSPKDTIYNLKQKIVEYLELGSNISRKMKLLKLKEFITLDDIRLKQRNNPRVLFNAEELDKPFQILDDYFASKDEDLKEFPLDIIILINNENNITTALDRKEKEDVIMAPHKPIATVIRETTLVNNSNAYLNKKQIDIDPSLFPSPPANINIDNFNFKGKERNNYGSSRYKITNYDNDPDMGPRTKSIIFNIDRFPSPPDDNNDQYIVNNNENNNNINNSFNNIRNSKERNKYTVYNLDQFPDAPTNEDFSITSKIPLTDEAPPAYETVTNKTIPSIDRSNMYSNSSITPSINQSSNQYEMIKKDKKSVVIRKSILISFCLCLGIMVSSFLAVIVGKILLDKTSGNGEPPKRTSSMTTYTVGSIKAVTTEGTTTSVLELATTTLKKPTQTPEIEENQGGEDKTKKELFANVIYSDPKDVKISWRIQEGDGLVTNLEINNINKDPINNKVKRDNKNPFNNGGIPNGFSMPTGFNIPNEGDWNNGFFNPTWNSMDPNWNSMDPNWNSMDPNWNSMDPNWNNFDKDGSFNNEDEQSEPKKSDEFTIDNDFTLNLTLQLKRIIEISLNTTNSDIQNILIISPETEIPIEGSNPIQDNSSNVGGGIINLKRAFSSKDESGDEKLVEVEQRLYVCNKKCSSKNENDLDPTKMKYTINLKKWNFLFKEPIIKFEFEVTSSKYYWSNESSKVVVFDKGQCLLKYNNLDKGMGFPTGMPLVLERIQDVFSNQTKSILRFDMFTNSHVPENKVSFTLQSDMNNYKLLNTIASSASSGTSLFNFNYYIIFNACIILLLYHIL